MDAFEHGVRLPPGHVLVVVEIGQVVGRMGLVAGARVANVARLGRSLGSGLRAKLAGTVLAARVRHFRQDVEGCIHELRDASL